MYDWLLRNHILTNLIFLLVIAAGIVSFMTLPRQQDPSVNFNWVEIHTRFPAASAADVEEQVTDVLEKVSSRFGISVFCAARVAPDFRASSSASAI